MSLSTCSTQVLEHILYWSDGIALLKLASSGNKALIGKLKCSETLRLFFKDIRAPLSALSFAGVRDLSVIMSRDAYVHPTLTQSTRFIPPAGHKTLVSIDFQFTHSFYLLRPENAVSTSLPALQSLSLTDYKMPLMEDMLMVLGKYQSLKRLKLRPGQSHTVISYSCLQALLKDGLEYLSISTIEFGVAEVFPQYDDEPDWDENGNPLPSTPPQPVEKETSTPQWALTMPSSLTHFAVRILWPEIANSILPSPNLEHLKLTVYERRWKVTPPTPLLIQPLMDRLPASMRRISLLGEFRKLYSSDTLLSSLPPHLEQFKLHVADEDEEDVVPRLRSLNFPSSLKTLLVDGYSSSLVDDTVVNRLCLQCPHLERLKPAGYHSLPTTLPTSLTDLSILTYNPNDDYRQPDYTIPAVNLKRLENLKSLKMEYVTRDQLLHLPKKLTHLVIEGSNLRRTLMAPPSQPIPYPPFLVSLSIDMRHFATPTSTRDLPPTLKTLILCDSRLPAEWLPDPIGQSFVAISRKYSNAIEFGRYLPKQLRKLVFRTERHFIPVFNWVAEMAHIEQLEELKVQCYVPEDKEDDCLMIWHDRLEAENDCSLDPPKKLTQSLIFPPNLRRSLLVLQWNSQASEAYVPRNFFFTIADHHAEDDDDTEYPEILAAVPDNLHTLIITGSGEEEQYVSSTSLKMLPASLNTFSIEGFAFHAKADHYDPATLAQRLHDAQYAILGEYRTFPEEVKRRTNPPVHDLIADALPSHITDLTFPMFDVVSRYFETRPKRPEFDFKANFRE